MSSEGFFLFEDIMKEIVMEEHVDANKQVANADTTHDEQKQKIAEQIMKSEIVYNNEWTEVRNLWKQVLNKDIICKCGCECKCKCTCVRLLALQTLKHMENAYDVILQLPLRHLSRKTKRTWDVRRLAVRKSMVLALYKAGEIDAAISAISDTLCVGQGLLVEEEYKELESEMRTLMDEHFFKK